MTREDYKARGPRIAKLVERLKDVTYKIDDQNRSWVLSKSDFKKEMEILKSGYSINYATPQKYLMVLETKEGSTQVWAMTSRPSAIGKVFNGDAVLSTLATKEGYRRVFLYATDEDFQLDFTEVVNAAWLMTKIEYRLTSEDLAQCADLSARFRRIAIDTVKKMADKRLN